MTFAYEFAASGVANVKSAPLERLREGRRAHVFHRAVRYGGSRVIRCKAQDCELVPVRQLRCSVMGALEFVARPDSTHSMSSALCLSQPKTQPFLFGAISGTRADAE